MVNEGIRFDKRSIPFLEAINRFRNINPSNFNEAIELHINLLTQNKNELNAIKGSLIFKNKLNKKKILASFTDECSINSSNVIFGIQNILKQIKEKKIKFDLLFTNSKNLPLLLEYGKLLGPKGLIPSKKNYTLTEDLDTSINEYLNGRIDIKPDKFGNIHVVLGTQKDTDKTLENNFNLLISKLKELTQGSKKNSWYKKIYLCTTMSESIKIKL